MNVLRVRQRWVSWYWGLFGWILAFIFGGIGAYCATAYPEDRPSVRVVVPMYGLAVYWVLACAFNRRTAVVTPDAVRVWIWPFPVNLPRRIRRDTMRLCFVRETSTYDDTSQLEVYYTAGVQTTAGDQVDVSGPHETAEEAAAAAHEIARVLNAIPGRTALGVRQVPQFPPMGHVRRVLVLAFLWLSLFIAAILLGFQWEERVLTAVHGNPTRETRS